MNYFYPASSSSAARALSEAIWSLCLPVSERQDGDTMRAFEIMQGANGIPYVNIPDDFTAVMHPEASMDPVAAVLQPFETAGHIPAGTVADMRAWVESTRVLPDWQDRQFVPWDKFPAYFQSQAVTTLPPEALPTTTLSSAPKR